jgi:hypothetical protein
MSDLAASGVLHCDAGQVIVAQPGTLTGSMASTRKDRDGRQPRRSWVTARDAIKGARTQTFTHLHAGSRRRSAPRSLISCSSFYDGFVREGGRGAGNHTRAGSTPSVRGTRVTGAQAKRQGWSTNWGTSRLRWRHREEAREAFGRRGRGARAVSGAALALRSLSRGTFGGSRVGGLWTSSTARSQAPDVGNVDHAPVPPWRAAGADASDRRWAVGSRRT